MNQSFRNTFPLTAAKLDSLDNDNINRKLDNLARELQRLQTESQGHFSSIENRLVAIEERQKYQLERNGFFIEKFLDLVSFIGFTAVIALAAYGIYRFFH